MNNIERWLSPKILLPAVLLLVWAVYFPGLGGPLVLDDIPQLSGLLGQQDLSAAELFSSYGISTSGPLGRPVAMTTFIADTMLYGDDTWWWKQTNLMIHLLCGLLVFALVRSLHRVAMPDQSGSSSLFALAVAAIWLLHPLNVSTVLYTVQRMTELSTLFVLAGLNCYVQGRLRVSTSAPLGWGLIGIAFVLFYPLGVFSKENALLFPVYCTLLELTVFRGRESVHGERGIRMLHRVLGVGYVVGAAFVLWNFNAIVLESYAFRDFTLAERLLTQFRVIMTYLGQIVIPLPGKMGFFHDDVVVSTSLAAPMTTLLSLAGLTALLASAVFAFEKRPLYAFGILFFFTTHLVESTALGLELMFEHRNHLGLIGILIAAADLVRGFVPQHVFKGLAAGLVVLVGIATVFRVQTWSSEESLYVTAFGIHPQSPRVNLVFSNAAAKNGDFARAREHLARTREGYGQILNGLFLDCMQFGRVDSAAIARLHEVDSGVVAAHATSSAKSLVAQRAAGNCKVDGTALLEGIDHILEGRIRKPQDRSDLLLTKARLAESNSELETAIDAYVAAQAAVPSDPLATYSMADMLVRHGNFEVGLTRLAEADRIAAEGYPRVTTARAIYTGFGDLKTTLKLPAADVYLQAIERFPESAFFHIRAAQSLVSEGRAAEANAILERLDDGQIEMDSADQAAFLQLSASLQ